MFEIDNQELVEMLEDVKASLRPQRQETVLESEYHNITAAIKTHPPYQLRLASPPPNEVEAHVRKNRPNNRNYGLLILSTEKKRGYHRTQVTKY